MSNAPDRLEKLLAENTVTGIDFVYVNTDQVSLDIYFLNDPLTIPTPLNTQLTPGQIRIYSPSGDSPDIPILPTLTWAPKVDGRNVVSLTTKYPGDFSLYRLHIDNALVDPYYNDVLFSFKANCPSDLDCEAPPRDCPPDEPVDFPVDYMARDYLSFKGALLGFASQRYPDWPDRLEADGGMMMVEIMSALGDEMAYYQDRIGREAYLETATQRTSIRQHARLVDYTIHDGLGATGWIDVQVSAGSGAVNAGIHTWAYGDNGVQFDFEVGHGLIEIIAGKSYKVNVASNSFAPHIWDKGQVCLLAGATDMYIEGHQKTALTFDDVDANGIAGKWVLLKTTPSNPAQAIRSQMVRLITVEESTDPVLLDPITHLPTPVTHVIWEPAQALAFDYDMTQMVMRGNLLPITAGKTQTAYFITGAELTDLTQDEQNALNKINTSVNPWSVRAIERQGPNDTLAYRFSLPGSDKQQLVYLGTDPFQANPEIMLTEVEFDGTCWNRQEVWTWMPSLVGENSAESQDKDYILEDGLWSRLVGYQLIGSEFIHQDYASSAGFTIRFGDGEFGLIPAPKTVFRVDYRLGGGRAFNIAAGAIQNKNISDDRVVGPCDPPLTDLSFIASVTNPLQATGGLDPQSPDEIRQVAPEAFSAVTYRAVRPEDYAEAAERLPWVQNAGAAFRWTGSWLTAFVTPDPKANPIRWTDNYISNFSYTDERGMSTLASDQRDELQEQIDRFRQAGREAYVLDPVYANMDIEIDVCVLPTAYRGEVEGRVLEALMGTPGFVPVPGYFSSDRFTFQVLI